MGSVPRQPYHLVYGAGFLAGYGLFGNKEPVSMCSRDKVVV